MILREQIEYAVTAATLKLSRILPEEAVYALFKGFGLLIHAASGRRRRISLRNAEIVFPEKSLAERKALVKQAYINLSESMALNTLIMADRISNEQLLDSVESDGWDNYEKANSQTGKGLLFISGHIGNWELMSQYIALRSGQRINIIARETTNPLLEEKIVLPLRERFGIRIFYKKKALMRIMKAINRGENAGIMIDQKLKPGGGGIFVEFFGRKAPTSGSPALLQVRFGITVLPVFMVKTPTGKYRLVIREPVQWQDNGKPMEEQVLELTRIHQRIVEEMVRQYPDQWFWMHNRWGLKKEER